MTDASYRKALDDLKRERDKLVADRDEMDRRLSRIDAAIANLAVVVDDEPFEGGLTEAVRTVLKRKPGAPMMPTEVRNQLKEIGYDITQHNNIMASVHSVLKRLAETPDVQALKSGVDGGFLYRWVNRLPITPRADPLGSLQAALKAAAAQAASIDPKILEEFAKQTNAQTKGLQEAFAKMKAAGLMK